LAVVHLANTFHRNTKISTYCDTVVALHGSGFAKLV